MMAKEPAGNADNTDDGLQKPKSKLNLKTVIVVVALLAIEAGVLMFAGIGSDPDKAEATETEITNTEDAAEPKTEGVSIATGLSIDSYTRGSAKMMIRLDVAATISSDEAEKEKFLALVKAHQEEIKDVIRVVVSSAQPDELKDSKKQVIKRSLQVEIEKIVGTGYIQDILIPEWSLMEMD